MDDKYLKALTRDDLSQVLIHLSCGGWVNGMWVEPKAAMMNILREGRIRASERKEIRQYDTAGAACLYDVPLSLWSQVVKTNPNNRRGYGLIVAKNVFWYLGGRPAIYDSDPSGKAWPETERYRLILTNLNRQPPVDWTHEREWRIRGELNLGAISKTHPGHTWWWPCVERAAECAEVFATFPGVHHIYSMESSGVLSRS
ncbi:MAG TPA: hypothetical protein VE153_08885 [Myxococcus sp.]|nr:hypothetical protein [Myxococcus sp.]